MRLVRYELLLLKLLLGRMEKWEGGKIEGKLLK